MLLGRRGLLGGLLFETMGIQLPFTTPAVIIAQVFVSMPFMVISLEGVLRSQDPTFALTAASLGASPWRVFWHVTLPMARAGLAAGTVLTFARALGEFGATALFAGNREGITQTMPLAIYTAFNGGGVSTSSAIALALLLLVVAFAVMMVTRSWYPKATK
jgi:ABC-type molybdate transport system, permease component